MKERLIISGWLADFACAAAVALHKYPSAAVEPISRNGLPQLLDRISRNKVNRYSEMLIMGVPLQSPGEALLRAALARLRKDCVKVVWFCSYPLPVQVSRGTLDLLEPRVSPEEKPLCRHVAEELGLPLQPGQIQNILRAARDDNSSTDADRRRRLLIEAAMSRYRRFQELNPFSETVRTISENRPLSDAQNAAVEEYLRFGHRELRGRSRAIGEIKDLVRLVGADGSCSVLICGETGTGKETIASLIHGYSPRRDEPFIEFNCAMMSPQLAESALFGHEKGSFTGADSRRTGVFEQADGGTLFLDEIGDLPLEIQAGILRVMQEGRFRRLGGMELIRTDVRIIAATNRSLNEMIREKRFREDLMYRLDVIHIDVPPLRDRPEDIEPIANSFLIGRGAQRLSHSELETLKSHRWPGNVRELMNVLERALVLKTRDFGSLMPAHGAAASSGNDKLHENLLAHVRSVYRKHGGNKARAAKALGVSVNTLKKHLKEAGEE